MAIYCDSIKDANKLFISLALSNKNNLERKLIIDESIFDYYEPDPLYVENYRQELQIILIPTNIQNQNKFLENITKCIKLGFEKNDIRFISKCRLCFISTKGISFDSIMKVSSLCEWFKFKKDVSHFEYTKYKNENIDGFIEDINMN